jgi:MoCo/4Fe-4S cofactor protein with predicted Tat translocation signal
MNGSPMNERLSNETNVVTGQELWRSLDEVADTEEFRRFVAKEFPTHAPEALSSSSRRNFLKVMGASLAFAGMGGLTGCLRWPREEILPFASRPEGRLPGVPVQFATALERDGVAHALLATSYDGRPIKVDGNPEHPQADGVGSLDLIGQGTVLDLYDPARSREVVQGSKSSDWAAARDALRAAAAGGGFAVLSAPSDSPTVQRMKERLRSEVSGSRWYDYSPTGRDNEQEGLRLLFGGAYRAVPDFGAARTVLCLDADLLVQHPSALANSRGFGRMRAARRAGTTHHRMISIEARHSVTGSVADERWAVKPSEVARLGAAILHAVDPAGIPDGMKSALGAATVDSARQAAVTRVAEELNAQRGGVLVLAGPHQPPEVHALAHAMNVALDSAGKTVRYVATEDRPRSVDAIERLAADIGSGAVKSLLVIGGNPVFDAPADLGLAAKIGGLSASFRLGEHQDETSEACAWHLPQAHYLETWIDGRSWDGTVTLTQPLIDALYGGRNAAEVLGLLLDDDPKSAYDLVRDTHRGSASGDFEKSWRDWVHRGFVPGTASRAANPRPELGWGADLQSLYGAGAEVEVLFHADDTLHDGRHANNGWLQECPDPMTKIAWGNAAIIAPADAERFGVAKDGDLVRVTVGAASIELPAFRMPGHAQGCVGLALGYGREVFDRVAGGVSYNLAKGSGVNVYPLRSAAAMRAASVAGQVSRTRGNEEIATTQDHWAVDSLQKNETDRRSSNFARVVDLDDYKLRHGAAVEALAGHVPPLKSLFDEHVYEGHRWGMSIDLDLCTGCTACVVACQAENNIAVTGKAEVAYGREMHWMRIDRYFRGADYDSPDVVHQPMTCHHCENAPCEQVCPVAATVHSAEGLNDMVYNRCIGTRYCSNNCPYKVRRFIYFNNAKHPTEQEQMVYNPDVTVRARGVMEKCTFCVQRIKRATIRAKNERREIRDGDVVTACQQTCPTQAITFGDLADSGSAVSREHASDRSYAMLEELNVKPRTHYLARVVNPPREGS